MKRICFSLVATICVVALVMLPSDAPASRDASGTYTLPVNSENPAVFGTPINPTDHNSTMNDIKAEITDSLSRSGKGGMTAPLTMSKTGTAATVMVSFYEPSSANGAGLTLNVGQAAAGNQTGSLTYTQNATAANSTWCMGVAGNPSTLCTDGNAKVYIGSGGTGISKSLRGTTSWTPGSIASGTSVTNNMTLTGAAVGADCVVTGPTSGDGLILRCAVSIVDQCAMTLWNSATGAQTGAPGTYACRVFNP